MASKIDCLPFDGKSDRLEGEDLQKAQGYIGEVLNEYSCFICGAQEFAFYPFVYTSTVFTLSGDHHLHNKVFPELRVECKGCGNILKFSSYRAGISNKAASGSK